MHASETFDFEREFAEVVGELRALPTAASRELRERVRALAEPEPRRAFRVARPSRRAIVVAVPACVLAVDAAAAISVIVSSSSSSHQAVGGAVTTVHGGAASGAGSSATRDQA